MSVWSSINTVNISQFKEVDLGTPFLPRGKIVREKSKREKVLLLTLPNPLRALSLPNPNRLDTSEVRFVTQVSQSITLFVFFLTLPITNPITP